MLTADPKPQESNTESNLNGAASTGGGLRRLRNLLGNPRLRLAIQAVVVLIVLGFVVRALWELWPDIVAYRDWRIEPLYLLAGLAVLIVRGPIICLGWRLIVRRLGYPLSWRRAIRIYFYSGMAKYLPGAMWYAVGRVLLAQQAGVPKMVTSISIAIETALVVVAAILVGSLALTVGPINDLIYLGVVLVGLLAFLAWPRPLFMLMNKGLQLLGRNPVPLNITGRDLLILLPPFMLSWVAYGFISFCWTAALKPELPWSEWPAITGLFTLAWVVGFLAILIPNGWGVREGLIILLLTGLINDIHPAVAAGAAVLSRLGSIIGEASWAFVAWQIKPEKDENPAPDL